MNELKAKAVLQLAVRAGEIMLQSGAETYRVEDTITRMLKSRNFHITETFVIPTCIIATIDDEGIELSTHVKRIKNRSTRLDKIALLNTLSRKYVNNEISTEEALMEVEKIDNAPTYSKSMVALAAGLTASFFSVMVGGNLLDFTAALLTGIIIGILQSWLHSRNIISYMTYFICGLGIGICVIASKWLVPNITVNHVIIGSIMPLVPGLAFTNAIRDTVGDELLSGISRGTEAIFIAISIATGVGVAIGLFSTIWGFAI